MAIQVAWTVFLSFSLIVNLFSYMECSGNISFAFPPQTDIKVGLDAYFHWEELELTTAEATGDLAWSAGWATYNKPVPLWDNSSRALASFTSHFQFLLQNLSDISSSTGSKASDSSKGVGPCAGQGITFFIAPLHYEPPEDAAGQWLGLFNQIKDGNSSNCIVAVEFDTFMDEFDPDDNHVGIDINSVVSVANVSLGSEGRFENYTLCNGEAWDAWVDYDGSKMELKVFLLYSPNGNSYKPISPILSYSIDLRDYIPEKVKIGLSASTGMSAETHTVYAWNFSSVFFGKTSPDPPPRGVPSYPVSSPLKPPSGFPDEGRRKTSKKPSAKVILISSSVCFLALCFLFFIGRMCYFKDREMRRANEGEEGDRELDEQFSQGPCRFSYAQLSAATRNFGKDEMLGGGGFGNVYRGILSATNEVAAIKKISQDSKQGKKEYISEVTMISKLRHRNLVRLLGWCHEGGEFLLVYEFLPNGSLDKYLFDETKVCFKWVARYNIACGLASALTYLHEECDECVVHRDVKASNVLLDSNFNAKLGDFGLARLVESGHAASRTTVVAGTCGYLAPEYIKTGKASPASDVYSFGAVALEIACGRQPIDYTLNEHSCRLVPWVWDLHGQGKLLDAADEKLRGKFNNDEIEVVMLVGLLLCSHPDPKARPTMREVLKILKFDAQLPYVPRNLPVAVYSDSLTSHAESSSSEMLSTSNSLSSRSPASGRVKGKNSTRLSAELKP